MTFALPPIRGPLYFIFIFSILFVGDFSVSGIFVLPLILAVSCCIALFFNFRLTSYEFSLFKLLFVLVLCALLVSLIGGVDRFYDFWPVWVVFGGIALKSFFDTSFDRVYPLLLLLAVCFLILEILWLKSGGTRGKAVFGPNILYRIFCFFLAISLVSYAGWSRVVLVTICFLGVIFTGSRGGLVVLLILLSLYLLYVSSIKRSFLIVMVSVLAFILLDTFLDIPFLRYSFDRLSNFSLDAFGARSVWLESAYQFFIYSDAELILGVGTYPNTVFQFYPHNLIVEILVGYGVFVGGVLALLPIFAALKGLRYIRQLGSRQVIIYLTFMVFFVSSIFSGSLFDNWPVFSLGVLVFSFKINRITV